MLIATTFPDNDLDNIFLELSKSDAIVRKQAAHRLQDYVVARRSLETPTSQEDWGEDIGRRLSSLITASNVPQKLGAILAVDAILNMFKEDPAVNSRNLFRFYNYLTAILRDTSERAVMVAASESLGKLARVGGTVLGDRFIEEQIPDLLEAVSSNAATSYGALLVLQEFAQSNPVSFLPRISDTFGTVATLLRNSQVDVRTAAAHLMGYVLAAMSPHDFEVHRLAVNNLLVRVQQGLKTNSAAVLHGSLLALRELFLHAGKLVSDRFVGTCETILRFRSHTDVSVRRAVITMLPTLASYDPTTFCEHFLVTFMTCLLSRLEGNDGPIAYLAIGHISSVVGGKLDPFIETLFLHIQNTLESRSSQQHALLLDHIFQAIGLLAVSLGPSIAPAVTTQLDLLFSHGLPECLVRMLETVVRHIPVLLEPIQVRLLDSISLTLSGRHYRPLGSPQDSTNIAGHPSVEIVPSKVAIALSVLGSFNFEGHLLNEFAVTAVLPRLGDEDSSVRKSAALTLCRILSHDPIRFQSSRHSVDIIKAILDKLLSLSIVDSDPHVREAVLSSLGTALDYQLAQAEYIRLLVIALHDEVLDNRILAARVLGRLSSHNPAQVAPSLRKTFVRLVTELRYFVTPRSREDAIRLLASIITSTQTVIGHSIPDLLEVLLECASDPNPVVTTHVLLCLGQLSAACPDDVAPYIPRIMRIILASLEGETRSGKLSAALDCLGQLCTYNSFVVTPIEDYPVLVPLLHRMLRREYGPNIRRRVIKAIGLLGAMDPYHYSVRVQGIVDMEHAPEQINAVPNIDGPGATSKTASLDPYQGVVVDLLVEILKQQSLSNHHHLAIDSLMSITKTRGVTFATSVPKIMPTFCQIIRSSAPNLQGYYLAQLTVLVRSLGQHIRICTPEIMESVHFIWDTSVQHLSLVVLVEALANALSSGFGPYIPTLIPRLLRILQPGETEGLYTTQVKVLKAFVAFASNLQEYLNLVVPIIISCYERNHAPSFLRKEAIQSLAELSSTLDLYPYTSRIIHSLLHVSADPEEELRQAVSEAFCTLAHTLGTSFLLFVPVILKTLTDSRFTADKLVGLLSGILRGETLPPLESAPIMTEVSPAAATLSSNRYLLKRAWDISRIQQNNEGWSDWFTHLTAQFVKESPSISLRSCMNLFDGYPQISTQLFNPAFASCWVELTEAYQEDLIRSVEHVVQSSSIPPGVAHAFLDLVEYMERSSTPLPISNASLADYCFNHNAYGKALHYQELHFFQDPSPATIEALIEINAMLRQGDAALGTLNLARQHYSVENPQAWYEKLGQWGDALPLYESMGGQDLHDSKETVHQCNFLGRLRCLKALNEWDQIATLTALRWPHSDDRFRSQLAPLGAAGAWHVGAWKALEQYCSAMAPDSGDRAFYRAVSSIHHNRLPRAYANILRARDLLDPELTSLLDESPDSLDRFAVQAQMISELEEIILYKGLADRPDRQETLRGTWKKRLLGCQQDLNVWQRILKVRSLAVKAEDDIDTIVRFANLCRKSGRLRVAETAMESLIKSGEHGDKAPPQVVYAQLKMLWADGHREETVSSLRNFMQEMTRNMPSDETDISKNTIARTLARCHHKYGNWRTELDGGMSNVNASTVLNSYHLATKYDPEWSKAWHAWALSNLEVIRNSPSSSSATSDTRPVASHASHIVAAIEGFFRAIQLMNRNALQDTLRLLTLWFKFGAQPDITFAMSKGIKSVACEMWLDVVPQIIARIQTPNPVIREVLNKLLIDLGQEHPQALVYPLTVAAKSPSKPRKAVALNILDRMRTHSWTLVEQAKLVGQELSRVAIIWGELWWRELQSSARHYFDGKPKAMLAALKPLYDALDQGPSTLNEKEFIDKLGPALQEARRLCQRHLTERDQEAFDKAWGIYLDVWRQLEQCLPEYDAPRRPRESKALDLYYVSPQLQRSGNLDLAVPGTYGSGQPVVKITSFKRKIPVLYSKQRPRRVVLIGDNGYQFVFLLKGQEDLRQDERVMQVIGLVNKLLLRDRKCLDRRLHLQRYPVTPLAPDVGLLSWMDGTDTLHNLITDFREARKILPDLERRMLLQEEPEYDSTAPLARKAEVFEAVMERTTGQDLYRVLWLKSVSSEAWVLRRTTYTRSLAVGSMVGYLLGIGDRHPANIMIGRETGKVIHIDFGDCFEVAIHRDKLPEKVPFRLTRMMRHAMEVCGIQGGFKMACEISMVVLRDNKETLLTVLEALVYDPLINWRLVRADSQSTGEVASSLGSTDLGPIRRNVLNENEILDEYAGAAGTTRETRNERALEVYNRVADKLTGRDFEPDRTLSVAAQVERLVQQATSVQNLCEHFHGWCPFW